TRSKRDWSSDVCSSDLCGSPAPRAAQVRARVLAKDRASREPRRARARPLVRGRPDAGRAPDAREGPPRSLAGRDGEESELDLRREPGVRALREGATEGDEPDAGRAESAGR